MLWSILARLWRGWRGALFFVQPRTVILWQRKRFREYWRGLCQTNANQVEFVIPGFRWTAQNTCDFQQPLGD
jgi:hypothetical protein